MNKFKKATKRIAAVAASAAMIVSAASAGLGNYPGNFVKDDKFMGQVVVGSSAAASDVTAAEAVIADLKAELSGEESQVKITAKKSSTSGESVKVADSGNTLNYGETLDQVKTSSFDDGDSDLLEDETLDFEHNEDYSQTIDLASSNGKFSHTLRDDLSSTNNDHVFFDKGSIISYSLELDAGMDMSTAADADIIGQELTIMGNEFTVGDYKLDVNGLSELELIGGANKVSLGEGETTTISVEGNDYEIAVESVSSSKVLLTVNGESQSITEYDTEDVAGVNIAVTDLVESSRDAVKGYAEIVIGGQKVLLKHGSEVEVNDEKISDLYDDYKVMVDFDVDGDLSISDEFEGFKLDYQWDNSDGIMLEVGDSFEDKVFQAFNLVFEDMNDVEYSTVTVESSGKELKLSGNTIKGDDFSEEIAHVLDKNTATTSVSLIGGDTDMPMLVKDFTAANYLVVDKAAPTVVLANNTAIEALAADAEVIVYDDIDTVAGYLESGADVPLFIGTPAEVSALFNVASSAVVSIKSTQADSGVRFLTGDEDNQQVYELTVYSESYDEFDVSDILDDSTKSGIAFDDLSSKLDDLTFTAVGGATDSITAIANTESQSLLAMENNLMVNLSDVTNADIADSSIAFTYDEGDMTVDDTNDAQPVTINFGAYDTTDEDFNLNIVGNNYVTFAGGSEDISDSDDNTAEYVTKYGTKVVYDAEDKNSVEIMTPDEQVEAHVSIVFGDANQEVKTYTVAADMADAKVAELEADGYSVTTEDVEATSAEFDIEAPMYDNEVTEVMDAIVVGGPAVNAAARELLGIESYDMSQAGVEAGEAVVRFFEDSNSVLVYGYDAAGTTAAVAKLNAGGLSGDSVNVQ